uniref:Uncharacterized protein n=2 Tax=Populus trichocarpa TaxID=3694 RepID=A0A3N7F5W7_POPTR
MPSQCTLRSPYSIRERKQPSITYKFLRTSTTTKTMCYKVTCKQCNKYSWGGCGNHLTAVYAGIEKGKHCTCKPWPGVVILTEETAAEQQPYRALSANSATKAAADARHHRRWWRV